jgi:hypothetical protein
MLLHYWGTLLTENHLSIRFRCAKSIQIVPTLATTQGQIDGFFRRIPFKCYLP